MKSTAWVYDEVHSLDVHDEGHSLGVHDGVDGLGVQDEVHSMGVCQGALSRSKGRGLEEAVSFPAWSNRSGWKSSQARRPGRDSVSKKSEITDKDTEDMSVACLSKVSVTELC